MDSDSSDIPLSDDCISNSSLGNDDNMRIVFHPDYIDYGGTQYLDSVVNFTRGSVEAKTKSDGDEQFFHILMEISDIVKIESQWSARCGAGTVSIYFISKSTSKVGNFLNDSVSGIEELKFPALDPNWYEKYEAIESLNVRYKALWNVLLDTGVEKSSPLPEAKVLPHPRNYFPNFDKPFDELIYPEGDSDAVSISKRDIDLLLPDTFVNDTIVDFYIKYLKSKLTTEQKTKFHFFNSFFFRKLADLDKDPSSAFDGKAAFQRVRKWTRKVNLLEKDFIFIPVNYSLHWSLIVICYFGETAVAEDVAHDKIVRVPCILHMDSIKGTHKDLKDLMQSYLWEEWKERQKETCEEIHSKFRNLKFLSLQLPQQQNVSDCGMFVLHYVERFLEEVPPYFNIHKVSSSSTFLQADWFPPSEASLKRTHIERLIKGLLEKHSSDSLPFYGSDIGCFSDSSKTSRDHHNDIEYLGKSSVSMRSNDESLLCPIKENIEMAPLPTSSERKTSASNLRELFDQGADNATWVSLEHRSPLHEFEKPLSLTQEDVAVSACYAQTILPDPAYQHLDEVNPGTAHLLQYSAGDFGIEPDLQPRVNATDSSIVPNPGDVLEIDVADGEKWQSVEAVEDEVAKRSGVCPSSCKLNTKESHDEISCQNGEKNMEDIDNQETDQLPANCASSSYDCFTTYTTGLECGEQEYQMFNSNNDPMHLLTLTESADEHVSSFQVRDDRLEPDEHHAAKRMRLAAPDVEQQLTIN